MPFEHLSFILGVEVRPSLTTQLLIRHPRELDAILCEARKKTIAEERKGNSP